MEANMKNNALIQSCMDGWKIGDVSKILTPLCENVVIIESHGPIYRGTEIVKKWVAEWTQFNKIEKWNLTSFYAFENMVFCEWNFRFTGRGIKEEFQGVTIAHIEHEKIAWLKEYRMTASPYEWRSE